MMNDESRINRFSWRIEGESRRDFTQRVPESSLNSNFSSGHQTISASCVWRNFGKNRRKREELRNSAPLRLCVKNVYGKDETLQLAYSVYCLPFTVYPKRLICSGSTGGGVSGLGKPRASSMAANIWHIIGDCSSAGQCINA